MTDAERLKFLEEIQGMNHVEMARRWRFGVIGDPMFVEEELIMAFLQRFKDFGGMTPEISKEIGWGDE